MWQDNFEALRFYISVNGRLPTSDDGMLFLWMEKQRSKYWNGIIDPDKEDALDGLELWRW